MSRYYTFTKLRFWVFGALYCFMYHCKSCYLFTDCLEVRVSFNKTWWQRYLLNRYLCTRYRKESIDNNVKHLIWTISLGKLLFRARKGKIAIWNKVSLISENNGRVKNVNCRFEVSRVLVCIQSKCIVHVPIIGKCKSQCFMLFLTKDEVTWMCVNENKF